MDIPHLENQRIELIKNLGKEKSPRSSLFLLYNYFDEILCLNDDSIIESFLLEFSQNYVNLLSQFISIGISPNSSKHILDQAKQILELNNFAEYKSELDRSILGIENGIKNINNSLAGETTFSENSSELSFPVLEGGDNNSTSFGLLETFTIKIEVNKSLKQNNFIIVPSSEQVEKRLIEQIKISWELAIRYLQKHFNNPYKYHNVIINFNKKYVQYEGYSLGMAITLGFLQELFRFYNTPLTLSVKGNVTFSGGMDLNGSIKPLSKEIIEKKIETVFFSDINHFALPEEDLINAQNKLNDLKTNYPNRKLKLIGVSDFEDLLNYRHILDIKKTKTTIRINKFIKKNKLTLTLFTILIGISLYYSFFTFDHNPHEFQVIENTVNILNKHGNILWSTEQTFDINIKKTQHWDSYHKIFDVNKDGTNEIFITSELSKNIDSSKYGRIACFDNYGKLIWEYNLRDRIANSREEYLNQYRIFIIDIIEEDGKPIIVAYAKHYLWSPSVIFKLDAITGKRLDGSVWSQGHYSKGTVCDFDNDGTLEVIIGGLNNALGGAFMLSIDVDKLNGQTPNKHKNLFIDKPIGKFNKFLLFEKTDLCKYYNNPQNSTTAVSYSKSYKQIHVNVDEKDPNNPNVGLVYKFENNYKSVNVQIGDNYQFSRDKLVNNGFLNKPLSSTKEYRQSVVDEIKEWDGEKFIKYKGNIIKNNKKNKD